MLSQLRAATAWVAAWPTKGSRPRARKAARASVRAGISSGLGIMAPFSPGVINYAAPLAAVVIVGVPQARASRTTLLHGS